MNAIEVRGLTKHYPYFTLDKLDLTLPEGCVLGLIGENGAGKSTTLKLLLNVIGRDAGEGAVLGVPLGEELSAAREEIGFVIDGAELPPNLRPVRTDALMRQVYKNWDADAFERCMQQFSIPPKTKYKALSTGNKMKLKLAVALSHHARLLILDEPAAGLDPVMRDTLVGALTDFTRDPTHSILISSHIVSDLEKLCDYIAFLRAGRLVLCEEKDRLFEQYGVIDCTKETLEGLDPAAVLGVRGNAYSMQALVLRSAMPWDTQFLGMNLEDLYLFLARGWSA
ncbi:MAG: ABC transporter ATP-binding protein [Clostridia bacterium]|nr:ABC transporter ATP-binding protein [Clostridia bacterium]